MPPRRPAADSSVLYHQPPWQRSALPNGMGRGVPDVAYSAAILHGILIQFLVNEGGGTFLFGGTSCGSPQWSALTAITNQKAGHRLGFLNSAIYQIGRVNKAYPVSFHDITSGTNSSGEFDSVGNPVIATGFMAGKGWTRRPDSDPRRREHSGQPYQVCFAR